MDKRSRKRQRNVTNYATLHATGTFSNPNDSDSQKPGLVKKPKSGNPKKTKKSPKVDPPARETPEASEETEDSGDSTSNALFGNPTGETEVSLPKKRTETNDDLSDSDSVLEILKPASAKQKAADKVAHQHKIFKRAVANLMVDPQFVILRYQFHEIAIVSPEDLFSGNPLVFHVQFGECYEELFKVGDVVKGEFGNKILYTAAICALVGTKEEADEAAKKFRRMGQIISSETKRYDSRPEVQNKLDRNQLSRKMVADSGSSTVQPAPTPSKVLDKAGVTAGLKPPKMRTLNDQYEEFMAVSDPFAGKKITPAAKTSSSGHKKKSVDKVPPGTGKKQNVGKSDKKDSKSPKEHTEADADLAEKFGFSQTSEASSLDEDYVYPYHIKGDNKLRISSVYKVYANKADVASAVELSNSKAQLAKALAFHLMGGNPGIKLFYRTKMCRHGVSKVHAEMVKAIKEFVGAQRKIGGVTGHPKLERIGQLLGSFLGTTYRALTGEKSVLAAKK